MKLGSFRLALAFAFFPVQGERGWPELEHYSCFESVVGVEAWIARMDKAAVVVQICYYKVVPEEQVVCMD